MMIFNKVASFLEQFKVAERFVVKVKAAKFLLKNKRENDGMSNEKLYEKKSHISPCRFPI